jgi:hypothetical protein
MKLSMLYEANWSAKNPKWSTPVVRPQEYSQIKDQQAQQDAQRKAAPRGSAWSINEPQKRQVFGGRKPKAWAPVDPKDVPAPQEQPVDPWAPTKQQSQ